MTATVVALWYALQQRNGCLRSARALRSLSCKPRRSAQRHSTASLTVCAVVCSVKRWKRFGAFLCASVGALFYFVGFYGLYAAAHKDIPSPMWLLSILAYVASNGGTWLEAAALATCVSNFETERGAVIGILKAFLGLSASVYTTLYLTLCSEPLDFLRLLAFIPPVVALVGSLGVHLVPFRQLEPHSKSHAFHIAMNATLSLAVYQLVSALYFRLHAGPNAGDAVRRRSDSLAGLTVTLLSARWHIFPAWRLT